MHQVIYFNAEFRKKKTFSWSNVFFLEDIFCSSDSVLNIQNRTKCKKHTVFSPFFLSPIPCHSLCLKLTIIFYYYFNVILNVCFVISFWPVRHVIAGAFLTFLISEILYSCILDFYFYRKFFFFLRPECETLICIPYFQNTESCHWVQNYVVIWELLFAYLLPKM